MEVMHDLTDLSPKNIDDHIKELNIIALLHDEIKIIDRTPEGNSLFGDGEVFKTAKVIDILKQHSDTYTETICLGINLYDEIPRVVEEVKDAAKDGKEYIRFHHCRDDVYNTITLEQAQEVFGIIEKAYNDPNASRAEKAMTMIVQLSRLKDNLIEKKKKLDVEGIDLDNFDGSYKVIRKSDTEAILITQGSEISSEDASSLLNEIKDLIYLTKVKSVIVYVKNGNTIKFREVTHVIELIIAMRVSFYSRGIVKFKVKEIETIEYPDDCDITKFEYYNQILTGAFKEGYTHIKLKGYKGLVSTEDFVDQLHYGRHTEKMDEGELQKRVAVTFSDTIKEIYASRKE